MSDVDGATDSVAVSTSSGPGDTAPIPTPGAQGASAPATPPAQDVQGAPSTPPAGAAAEQPKGNDAGDDPADKPKGGFQKRIAELTRRASDAERDRERLLSLLERSAPQPAAGAKPEATDDQPPQQSQFKSYEEYIDARADWRAEQRVKAILKDQGQQTQQQQTEDQFKAKVAEFNSTIVKEGKDIEGFAEAHAALTTPAEEGGPEVHPVMADFLMTEAENKAAMVKFLGENPDEATKLSRLHPRTMINRLARLDAQLGAKPPAKVSNAPPPPPIVNGSSAPVVDLAKADMDTYAAHWHGRKPRR